MFSPRARAAAANSVKAFLAEVAATFLGEVYDHKKGWGGEVWAKTLEYFEGRCAYCNMPAESLPKGVRMTMEHLIEENQWQCGLHHPANTVPACSTCNGSRDQSPDGSRLTWQQHLENLGKAKKWNASTVERRRQRIQEFVDGLRYPSITVEEMTYLRTTAQALYQDILRRSTAGAKGFTEIHGEAAVRGKPILHAKKKR